jgi:hypothetical protein
MQVTVNVQIFGENILNICVMNFEVNTKIFNIHVQLILRISVDKVLFAIKIVNIRICF